MNVWNDMVSVIVAVWRVLSFYRKYHMYTQSTYVASCPPAAPWASKAADCESMDTKYCAQSKGAQCPTGFEDCPQLGREASAPGAGQSMYRHTDLGT